MDTKEKLAALKKLKIVANCSESEMNDLASRATLQKAPRGQSLISEDTETNDVFGVISGRVDVLIAVPGSEKREVIATIQAGEFFGEMILLGRGRRAASAQAKDDVTLLVWSKKDLLELFAVNRNIGYEVMSEIARVLADRLYSTNLFLRNTLSRVRTP